MFSNDECVIHYQTTDFQFIMNMLLSNASMKMLLIPRDIHEPIATPYVDTPGNLINNKWKIRDFDIVEQNLLGWKHISSSFLVIQGGPFGLIIWRKVCAKYIIFFYLVGSLNCPTIIRKTILNRKKHIVQPCIVYIFTLRL